jgi:hypothetical protein
MEGWIWLIWFRIFKTGWILWTRQGNFGFHKMLEISLPAEELLAS